MNTVEDKWRLVAKLMRQLCPHSKKVGFEKLPVAIAIVGDLQFCGDGSLVSEVRTEVRYCCMPQRYQLPTYNSAATNNCSCCTGKYNNK